MPDYKRLLREMRDIQLDGSLHNDDNRNSGLYKASNMVAERVGAQTSTIGLSSSRLRSISNPESVYTPLQLCQLYKPRETVPDIVGAIHGFIGMVQGTAEAATPTSGLTVAEQVASIDANYYRGSSASNAALRRYVIHHLSGPPV